MAEKIKIPKIRFKGFSEEWEEKELREVSDSYSGGTPSVGNEEYYGGDIPFIRSAEINSDSTELFITQKGLNNSSAKQVSIGYILYALYGATSGEVGRSKINGAINQAILALIPKNGYDAEFIMQWLRKKKREIINTYLQGGQGNLSGSIVKDLNINLPCYAEQSQIGTLFSHLDHLITLRQRKYNKLVTIKKAMLEKMFPQNGARVPEIRFKGFTEEWEEIELNDEVEFYTGLTYSPNDVIKNGGTLVLRSSNVKNGEIVYGDNVYVNSNVVNCNNVRVGDIIVVVRNGSRSLIGKHAQIKEEMNNTVIGAFMTGIHSNQSAFINSLLDTVKFESEIQKNLGATINQITTGVFKKMQFMFPESEEQKNIGSYFSHLDHLITLQKHELEKLKNIKKACLEKMLV